MTIDQRIEALRSAMKAANIDAYIIPSSDPHQSEYVADHWNSRSWISGFTGSAGNVVITHDHAGLWTDGRYFLQAEEQLKNSQMELHKLKVPHAPEYIDWLAENLKEKTTLGFDGKLFTVGQIAAFNSAFNAKNISLKTDRDLFDEIWNDRPSLPTNLIFEHAVKFAGRSRSQKLEMIHQEMEDQKVTHHLIPTLDDIAWTLNIRSNDVECNPVAIAYLIVGISESYLFIDPNKVSDEMKTTLRQEQVLIKDYHDIDAFLNDLSDLNTILINPSTTSHYLSNQIKKAKVAHGKTISTLMKGIKNEVEIGHLKEVMVKDAVALTKLFRWLDKTLDEREVPEVEVAQQLIEFRKMGSDYFGESFGAIVGYKGNGAIIHYSAQKETCANIEKNGILLLDSGGQYFNGTTDITRTITFSPAPAEQKRDFTLVLKGHIGLANAKFPIGTRGNQIEVLARQHLWEHGLDYGHGTGHGVGFFLNVHEGPQAIGPGATSKYATPIVAGMYTSNEPGFYKTGEYGIRIENLVITVEDDKTAYGDFLKFETITLFPIDQGLIEVSLLDEVEINWLNNYHAEVFEKVSPYLDDAETDWMKEMCKPIVVAVSA